MSTPNAFEKLAQAQEAALSSQQPPLARSKESLLRQLGEPRQPDGRRHRTWLAAAAGILVIAGLSAMILPAPAPPHPEPQGRPDQRWFAASDTGEAVDFEDGSRIVLAPNASARVTRTAPHAVQVLMSHGEAQVRVAHSEQTDWRLDAGPYTVRVTGTAFTISWDASAARFSLDLQQGSVVVTGPMLEEGKRLRGGERLAADVTDRRVEVSGSGEPPRAARRDAPPAPLESAAPPGRALEERPAATRRALPKHRGRTGAPEREAADPASWSALCRQGAFGEVVSAAQRRGLEQVIRSGSLEDLMALGEAARLTRNAATARDVYRSVRTRYAGTPQAAAAAFFLGKIAFDQQRAFGAAATWLETYLSERPEGALARDALGKLIEAQLRNGDADAARRNARLYLSRHRGGPHTEIAQHALDDR